MDKKMHESDGSGYFRPIGSNGGAPKMVTNVTGESLDKSVFDLPEHAGR